MPAKSSEVRIRESYSWMDEAPRHLSAPTGPSDRALVASYDRGHEGLANRAADAVGPARIHAGGDTHAGARHRRQHRGLYGRARRFAGTAAVRPARRGRGPERGVAPIPESDLGLLAELRRL